MKKRADGRYAKSITVNGKRVFFYGKTKAEVERRIYEYNHRPSETLQNALESFLAFKVEQVSYKTYEGYKAPIKRLVDEFGDCPVDEITPAMIQAFINNLATQDYNISTVSRHKVILNMFYDWYITQSGSTMNYNPCSSVRIPSSLTYTPREMASREDIAKVQANLNAPFGLFAYTLLYSGLRPGELLALTSSDLQNGTIQVSKSVSFHSNTPTIKTPKTKNSIRSVIILKPLADALPKFKGYLFSPDGGKSPLTQTEYRHRWKAYKKAAGLSDSFSPYLLRHEFASICHDAGLSPKDTQALMGHADIETTLDIYTHIQRSRVEKSYKKLEKYVVKKKSEKAQSTAKSK